MDDPDRTNVLFVDDDDHVLAGLRRRLRNMQASWRMRFASSGREALHMLEAEPAEVVVTDMRMSGMDGVGLLAEVKQRHPATMRVVLSGHSSRKDIVRAWGPTHLYLSKPCEVEDLKRAVGRARTLHRLMLNDSLRALVGRLSSLPTIPDTHQRLLAELDCEDVSIPRVGRVVSSDPAISVKILQMANSAYFSLSREVTDPARAVFTLGLEMTRAIVLSEGVFSVLKPSGGSVSVSGLWKHSIATSLLARRIAEAEGGGAEYTEWAFTGGLLHDIGSLAMAVIMPEQNERLMEEAAGGSIPIDLVEQERIGATHADVGAYLACLWGLPEVIVEAIRGHHGPAEPPGSPLPVPVVVHLADFIELTYRHQRDPHRVPPPSEGYIERQGMDGQMERWRRMHEEILDGGLQ